MKPMILTMQAFGSYGQKTVLDFTRPQQNVFLITGDTGSGKTTIFDAIVFALYGEASSDSNKKDGTELQSQYVDYHTAPYVELVFSAWTDGEEQTYTVHRVPRHFRCLKKGTGVREEKETVELLLPDGTAYAQNQKETDRKLEEIVGLSKSQFMQVAMIAQGEFMELLRADSNKKKEIFRRLFHTSLYQDVVQELDRRRKAKASDISQIQIACQTEAAHAVIPAEDEQAETLREQQNRLCSAENLQITDLEDFLEGLHALCERTGISLERMQENSTRAEQIWTEKRDAYHAGTLLAGSFEELEKAERELTACAAEEAGLSERKQRMTAVRDAYEVQNVYRRLADSVQTVTDTETAIARTEEKLPALRAADTEAAQQESVAEADRNTEAAACTRVTAQVQKAAGLFREIRQTAEQETAAEAACRTAETKEKAAQEALQALEERENGWKQEAESLARIEVERAEWNSHCQETERLLAETGHILELERQKTLQKQKTIQAQTAYQTAGAQYREKQRAYEAIQGAFLDAQAGFLAREHLHEGKPCPVCGSLDHPNPCRLAEEHRELTRDAVEKAGQEADSRRKIWQTASEKAGTEAARLEEKEKQYEEARHMLYSRTWGGHPLPDVEPDVLFAQAEQKKQALQAEETVLRQKEKQRQTVQGYLEQVIPRKEQYRTEAEQAAQAWQMAVQERTAVQAKREALEAQKEYPDWKTAAQAQKEAEQSRQVQEDRYAAARQKAQQAKKAHEQAETLLGRYRSDLPGQRAEQQTRQKAYAACLAEKQLTETEWMHLTETYPRTAADDWQKQMDQYTERKAAATGARDAARKAIGNRAKPDQEILYTEQKQAEETMRTLQESLSRQRDIDRGNRAVYAAMAPKREERTAMLEEYTALHHLYERLAGKVSGGRMDLETYVQRYYLQRILHAANTRFREMSAGQFELRMMDAAQAGEGKNRGLDLLVYSVVTGKEREVRTLSGGESFMAALALALGMADQIQENAASIHLDMMFIDEGFGSLDDHARGQAVRVLREMAGSSKLIAMISHVTELKQEIEDQLVVSKDRNGSHARWVIS